MTAFRPFLLSLALLLWFDAYAEEVAQPLQFDPFERSALAEPAPEEAAAQEPPVVEEPPPRLTATLVSAGAPMVILGGELLRPGESHAGYVLETVREHAAVFRYRGELVEIEVDGLVTGQ